MNREMNSQNHFQQADLHEIELAIAQHMAKIEALDQQREMFRQGLGKLLLKREQYYAEHLP